MPYWRTFYHLIWATRNREPLIGPVEEDVIRRSFTRTCTELRLIPHAVGIVADHVHVVISIPPSIAPSEVLKRLKGASSHAVNQAIGPSEFQRFGWQAEYGMITFGERSLSMVIDYVLKQPVHHAQSSILAEFERTEPNPESKPRTADR